MGYDRKTLKIHYPNRFEVNHAKLEVHQVEFQKVLESCQQLWLSEIVKNGSQSSTCNSKTVIAVSKMREAFVFGYVMNKKVLPFSKILSLCLESKLEVGRTKMQQIMAEAQQIVDLRF